MHKTLVKSIKGDPKAQQALYRNLHPVMYRIGLRYAATKEDAVEIVNDAFIKLLKTTTKQAKQIKNIEAWVTRVTVNTAIDRHRKELSAKADTLTQDLEEVAYKLSDHSDNADQLSHQEYLEFLLRQLKPAERFVFNMHVIEGYSHKEIGDQLKCSPEMSRKHLKTGRATLKARLATITKQRNHGA